MEQQKTYSRNELEGLVSLLSAMFGDSDVFNGQAQVTKKNHPWLVPIITALENKDNKTDVSRHGQVTASMLGDSTLLIHFPEGCTWENRKPLWAAHLPYYFAFHWKGERYQLREVVTPYTDRSGVGPDPEEEENDLGTCGSGL